MKEYHKIQTVFKRDPETNFKTLLEEEFSRPEFEFLKEGEWVFTEKVDGMNTRVILDEGLRFGGKTDAAQMPRQLVERLAERFDEERLRETFPEGVCLYGEGYGPKIQKGGGRYRLDQDFVLFDIRVGDWWLERSDVEAVAANLDLDVAPVIGRGTIPAMVDRCRSGFLSQWGDFPAEGIVARPAVELRSRSGDRVITKLKIRDFPS